MPIDVSQLLLCDDVWSLAETLREETMEEKRRSRHRRRRVCVRERGERERERDSERGG